MEITYLGSQSWRDYCADFLKHGPYFVLNTVDIDHRFENTVKFANALPHNELIKKLAKYDIERILIEEATLDDMFLHYYQ